MQKALEILYSVKEVSLTKQVYPFAKERIDFPSLVKLIVEGCFAIMLL